MLATRAICRARVFYYSLVGRLVLYPRARWLCTLLLVTAYIYNAQRASYDVATYLIGFYLLQLLLSYYTPQGVEDEPQESQSDYYYLGSEEFIVPEGAEEEATGVERGEDKPLLRSMGELQVWERATFAFIMGLVCTYFKMLQIDVFWPLLLVYFLVLVVYTLQKILKTMEKHRYSAADFQKN